MRIITPEKWLWFLKKKDDEEQFERQRIKAEKDAETDMEDWMWGIYDPA